MPSLIAYSHSVSIILGLSVARPACPSTEVEASVNLDKSNVLTTRSITRARCVAGNI